MAEFMRRILYYEHVLEFKESTGSVLLLEEVHDLKLCRLCLSHKDFVKEEYRVVDLDGKLLKTEEMLVSCTGINLSVNDVLPRHLCQRCVEQISTLYFFQLQVERAQAVLYRLLEHVESGQAEQQTKSHEPEQVASGASVSAVAHSNADSRDSCDPDTICTEELDVNLEEERQRQEEVIEVTIVMDDETLPAEVMMANEHADDTTEVQQIDVEIHESIYLSEYDAEELVAENTEPIPAASEKVKQLVVTTNLSKQSSCLDPGSATVPWLETKARSIADEYLVEVCDSDKQQEEVSTCAAQQSGRLSKSRRRRDTDKLQQKNYACIYCFKEFQFKNMLMSHTLRVHRKDKAFQCNDCNTTYTQLASLYRHRRKHFPANERKVCEVCGKTFLRCDDWRRHMRTHTGERPYACNECDKAFKQINELKDHQRCHSTKKYVCKICDARLSSRNGFYIHQKAHAGIKKYECADCQKRFITNGELKSHMNVHLKSAKNNGRL